MSIIRVTDVHKKFKVYYDKGSTLKEKALFHNRNRYEDRWVLRGVSFELEKGECIGLIGENGCGKSTMLKMLSRIMYPDKGTIEVNGRVSSLIELGAGFHPDMTGRENIYTNAAIFGLTRKEIDDRVGSIIAFSELGEYIDNPVRTYSSGMYMRLAFSVAINVDADILLIDEILAVGDANFQAKCFGRLREMKAKGVTIVIVTHDTNTVCSFCNKAIWINDGRVMASGRARPVVDRYLQFMNQKFYASMQESLQEEQAGENGPEGESGSEQPQNADTARAGEAGGADGGQADGRYGLRTTEAVEVEFCGAGGEKTRTLYQGQPAVLEIRYRQNKPSPGGCVFGVGFYTLEGECIYAVNTKLDGQDTEHLRPEGKVTFRIEELPLLAGRYMLEIILEDADGVPLDHIHDCLRFDVVSGEKAAGTTLIRHEWTIE